MEIYPHGSAVATLPNQLRPPPSAVNSLQTARFNRDVVFQIPRRVSELAARYGRLRTVCPWQRTVSAPTGARPDRGRTLVREVRGLRAEQGPWSRRRDARTTTKAGLHRPSRAGRVWLLHAWRSSMATWLLPHGWSSPSSGRRAAAARPGQECHRAHGSGRPPFRRHPAPPQARLGEHTDAAPVFRARWSVRAASALPPERHQMPPVLAACRRLSSHHAVTRS
jgi:hypothetical protein